MAKIDLSVEIHPIDTTISVEFAAEILDPAGINPVDIIHASDPFKVRATVTLGGAFSVVMCGQLGVQFNLDAYGHLSDHVFGPHWKALDPCGSGVYVFDFDFPAHSLPGVGVGTPYFGAFTFATKTPCDTPGPVHGYAKELTFEIVP